MLKVNDTAIAIKGHKGTWHVIDRTIYNGKEFYLLEHDIYGDEVACLIIDEDGDLLLEDVWNGFDDLYEQIESII